MDSSSLSSIMKGVGGCVVRYEFTRFVSTNITAIAIRMTSSSRDICFHTPSRNQTKLYRTFSEILA